MNQDIPYAKIQWIEDIKNMTIWHWIRLGICFGLFNWVDYISKLLLGVRGIERAMTIYQMGIMDRNNGTTLLETVGDIYISSFIFEMLLVLIIVYGLWILLVIKFGMPKKIINFKI